VNDEPYGYDTDGDGWIDTEDRGSLYGYDFDGDGDIDADDDFYGDMMAYEAYRSGACFVATVVYGDEGHPNVKTLRAFRDRVLARYRLGRVLIRVYYRLGPAMAGWIERRPRVEEALRWMLDSFVEAWKRKLR